MVLHLTDDTTARITAALQPALEDAIAAAIVADPSDPTAFVAKELLKGPSAHAHGSPRRTLTPLAQLQEENRTLRAELEQLRKSVPKPEKAAGEVRGVNSMNIALYKMGALRHEPPRMEYFDPALPEKYPVVMKEIKLPLAQQTHEVVYEPVNRVLLVSQMSNSVLVRIPIGDDGLLVDDQDAWQVGPVDPKRCGAAPIEAPPLLLRVHPPLTGAVPCLRLAAATASRGCTTSRSRPPTPAACGLRSSSRTRSSSSTRRRWPSARS